MLDDCAQLVKANSIQGWSKIHPSIYVRLLSCTLRMKNIHHFFLGNKMNNVGVVYTLWENLKKTNDMEVGQVGFHKQKEVGNTFWTVCYDNIQCVELN